MKITSITIQTNNPDRVNLSVDGKYRLSLEIVQLVNLGLKQNQEIDEATLEHLEKESEFGKLYARALEYALMRPHSSKEIRDYLTRKTLATKYRSKKTNEVKLRAGVDKSIAERVYDRLEQRGYIDDSVFAKHWVENRHQIKGVSRRKIIAELRAKGIEQALIDSVCSESERNDVDELKKVIIKKQSRYPDRQKFIQYLARQGFNYDDITTALQQRD